MEIRRLNCSACGAPINVPEDVDFLNCTSCGSYLGIQRGEGYITLKIIKEVAATIKESGAETQSAIRDGAYATKTELQKLQLTQEISMVEMQLSSLQGEVRGVERSIQPGVANPRVTKQLQELHFQEYGVIERLRNLRMNLAVLNSADPENDPVVLENQLLLVRSALEALEQAEQGRGEVRNALNAQQSLHEQLTQKLLQINIYILKAKLPSYKLTLESAIDASTAKNGYDMIVKDIKQLEQMPQTQATAALWKNRQQTRDIFYQRWRQFETQLVQMNSESLNLPNPKGLDASQLQANLAHIQNDIHTLSGWQENDINRTFLNNLRNKEKSYQKALRRAEGKDVTLFGAVGGLLTGLVLLLQGGRKGPAEKPLVVAGAASQSPVEPQGTAVLDTVTAPALTGVESRDTLEQIFPRQRIWRAVGLGVLVLFLTSCMGFFAYGITDTAQKGSATWPFGILFLSIFVGFVGGIGVFFKSTKLLPVKPIVKAIGLALAVLIGEILLSIALEGFFPSDRGTHISTVGICLAPLSTAIVFIVSMIRLRSSTPT